MKYESHANSLWHIYRQSDRPQPWSGGGNLPWSNPDFSKRMLREHLDDSHGAASRTNAERRLQLDWLRKKLALQAGSNLLDITCGPGLYAVALAQDGLGVTGVDFGPAAIAYARELARDEGVAASCHFVEADVRSFEFGREQYDAALLLYGQLAVFPRDEAAQLLSQVANSLRDGGRLAVELLEQERVDKKESSWWFSDERGLWGDAPFLSLGQRFWYDEEKLSCERYYTLHLETGELDEILLCDQTYSVGEMEHMMREAGFKSVTVYRAWDGLALYDAEEWNVFVAEIG